MNQINTKLLENLRRNKEKMSTKIKDKTKLPAQVMCTEMGQNKNNRSKWKKKKHETRTNSRNDKEKQK